MRREVGEEDGSVCCWMEELGERKEVPYAQRQPGTGLCEQAYPASSLGLHARRGQAGPWGEGACSQGLLWVQGDAQEVTRWPGEVTTSGWGEVRSKRASWKQ